MSSPPFRSTPPDRDRQGVARGIRDCHEPAAPDLEDSRLREVRGALVRGTAVSLATDGPGGQRHGPARGGDTSGRYPMAHPDTGGISLTSASGVPRARDIKIVLIPDFRT